MKQKIIVTALPNGINAKGGNWKISAAIGLQVEDVDTTLQNVPDMLNWIELVKNAKFIVQLNGNNVEAKVTSKPVDVELWKNLFTPTVKVKSFQQEDLSNMPIASYPVKHIVSFIKFVAEATGKNHSSDLPPGSYFIDNPIMQSLSDYTVGEFKRKTRLEFKPADFVNPKRTGRVLRDMLNKMKVIPFDPKANPEMDFAQVKNFHGVYSTPNVANYTPIPPPNFEFHQVLAALSNYPQLLRRLGLIVDLEFPAPGVAVKIIGTPNVRVVPSGINFQTSTQYVCPATAYLKTASGFYPKALDGSSIDKGYLKINSDGFTVFQVDTDGAALKMCQQMDTLVLKRARHIFFAAEGGLPDANGIPVFNNEAPRKEGLPSNRSAGIAVAKDGRAAAINASFKRMADWKTKLMNGSGAPQGATGNNATWVLTNELMFADDLNLGYRMDIMPEGSKWFSLHKRNNRYSYIKNSNEIEIPGIEMDEGFIQTAASEEQTETGPQLKVGEAIARWEGWSLSVPRPGSSLNDPMIDGDNDVYDKSKPGNAAKEEAKYKTPGTADFKLNVRPMIEKGSLPMLRFGKRYSIKIRTVDMAGNSVDLETKPEDPGVAIVSNIRYMRYEPVEVPALVLGTPVKDGESAEVVVIRSNEGISVAQYENNNVDSKHTGPFSDQSIRHVKPPRSTVEMATTHSMLDKGMGAANGIAAKAIYNDIVPNKDPFVEEANNSHVMKVVDGNQKVVNIEYLVDPMAAGVTFYLSANDPNPKPADVESLTRRVSFYTDPEITSDAQADGLVINYESWMKNVLSFRVVLREADVPSVKWDAVERKLIVSLQKGVMFRMNYATFWKPSDIIKYSGTLEMMGLNNLTSAVGQRIARGQHWMFSPFREISFVHAVQQPLSKVGAQPVPAIPQLIPERDFGDTFANLHIKLLAHGPSTGKLDIAAEWTEWVDDVTHTEPGPNLLNDDVKRIPTKATVYHFTTPYLVFEYAFGEQIVKGNPFGPIQHKFNDTKHRKITYKAIATTRYREYFYQLIADKGNAFPLTRENTFKDVVIIPSSARPVAPQVEYVIPNFEWERNTNGLTTVTARISGLRVYMRRPWYSSGEGEQLGVVVYLNINDNFNSGSVPVTTWGTDPTKLSAALPDGIRPNLQKFLKVTEGNAIPMVSTVENPDKKVSVVAYDVKYDKERQLYYADIMMDFKSAYFPFVRLALARFQRHSVKKGMDDCCLSAIVQTDYIQIPPPRLSSLKFAGPKNVITVAISGTIPNIPQAPHYRPKIHFLIEEIDYPATEDTHITIGNKVIMEHVEFLQPGNINNNTFLFQRQFTLPMEYSTKAYRVKILEYEMITYDPLKPNPNPGGAVLGSMPMKDRLVYADVYEVNK